MKRRIGFVLSFLLLITAFVQPLQAADKEPRKILSGWIPYYSVKTVLPLVRKLPSATPNVAGQPAVCDASQYGAAENEAIESSYLFTNKDLMREVMPFWYSLKSPTVIRDDYVSGNPSWPIADTVCLMRRAGLQIIPTMTDGTAKLVLSEYLANVTTRTTIVKTIVDLVIKNDFDGIDLDYEGFAFVDVNSTWSNTAPRWVALVKELSVALHAKNKLLSVSTPYVYDPKEKQKGYFVYAWADIASSIDRLRIMTYDYSVARPGPMGPLAWTEKTIQYAVSIMSASKVYVGLPGYGRDWITSVKGKCPTSAPPGLIGGAKAATFKMNYAAAKAAIDGAVPTYNEQYGEATYSYTQSYNGLSASGASTACTVNRTVWYQNAQSFAARMALVAKYRLGGAAMWTMTLENVSQGSINYGTLFTVKGMITLKDKTPIAGLSVALEIKRANESTWTKIADLVTAQDGSVTTPMTLGGQSALRLTTTGTWERAESVSSEEKIAVKSLIQIDRPLSALKTMPITIKAQLLPKLVGKSANLQKYSNGKWQNIGTASVSDATGLFTFTTSEAKRGVVKLRIQVIDDIASEPFAIVIR